MTPELLKAAGEALFGQQWQAPLARDLGVSDRTIRRWLGGKQDIAPSIACDLWTLCYDRIQRIGGVMQELQDEQDRVAQAVREAAVGIPASPQR